MKTAASVFRFTATRRRLFGRVAAGGGAAAPAMFICWISNELLRRGRTRCIFRSACRAPRRWSRACRCGIWPRRGIYVRKRNTRCIDCRLSREDARRRAPDSHEVRAFPGCASGRGRRFRFVLPSLPWCLLSCLPALDLFAGFSLLPRKGYQLNSWRHICRVNNVFTRQCANTSIAVRFRSCGFSGGLWLWTCRVSRRGLEQVHLGGRKAMLGRRITASPQGVCADGRALSRQVGGTLGTG